MKRKLSIYLKQKGVTAYRIGKDMNRSPTRITEIRDLDPNAIIHFNSDGKPTKIDYAIHKTMESRNETI